MMILEQVAFIRVCRFLKLIVSFINTTLVNFRAQKGILEVSSDDSEKLPDSP